MDAVKARMLSAISSATTKLFGGHLPFRGAVRRHTSVKAYVGNGDTGSPGWDARRPKFPPELDGALIFQQIGTVNYADVLVKLNDGVQVDFVVEFMVTSSDPANLAQIGDGVYDAQLHALVADIVKGGKSVNVRIMHEANGHWYPWGAYRAPNTVQEFKRAFRLVSQILRQTNLISVQLGLNSGATNLAEFDPGDAFYDSVSVSVYNRAGLDEWAKEWRSFSTLFRSSYDQIVSFTSKPIGIGEVSTVGSTMGGDKAQWIRDAWDALATEFPRVTDVDWFFGNFGPGGDFDLNTPEDEAAWVQGLARFKKLTRIR